MNEIHDNHEEYTAYSVRLRNLTHLIVELQEKQCIAEVKEMLAGGYPPSDILDSCVHGMQKVGQRFEDGRYFISALIMAGVIMRKTTDLLEPYLHTKKMDHIIGTLLLGTVAGDIHDLGKNLFAILARTKGINVVDLGVDVPITTFLAEAQKIKPSMIGISCVLTTTWPKLKQTVTLLREELPNPRPPIIIGGTSVDEYVFRYVKSDFWVRDASEGVAICQRVMKKTKP
ncbi:MAG: cobalamin-dependent protein [Desulfobacteraceae bacterium]|jgi:methanogenic corrinoid protein MtbC1